MNMKNIHSKRIFYVCGAKLRKSVVSHAKLFVLDEQKAQFNKFMPIRDLLIFEILFSLHVFFYNKSITWIVLS